jgi:hypothetical protein
MRVSNALAVVAVALTAFFSSPASLHAQEADTFAPGPDGWQSYVNGRYGFRLDFPADVFTPEPPPDNGDGRTFTSSDATLQVSAFQNLESKLPAALRDELVGSEGYENVTYSPSGEDWLVLSGFRGETIFYEKYFVDDAVISAFGIEFPKDRKPFYAPIIERIEDSFRARRAD